MIGGEAPRVLLLRRPFTAEEAREVAAWRYPPPYDVYDTGPGGAAVLASRTPEGEGSYPAVDASGAVVAFCVYGAEARVAGQEAVAGVLDVGAGVRPDLTSTGIGTALLPQALALGRALFAPSVVRTAVAVFNTRSLALCRRAGLEPVRDVPGPGGRPFRELAVVVV